MIAISHMDQTPAATCQSCWTGPCNDGTGCTGLYAQKIVMRVYCTADRMSVGQAAAELVRLSHDYDESMRYRSGPPITFEEFVRLRTSERREDVCHEACRYGGIGCQC